MSNTETKMQNTVKAVFAQLSQEELPSARPPTFRPQRDGEPLEHARAVVALRLEDIQPDIVQIRALVDLAYLKELAEGGNRWALGQLAELSELGRDLRDHGQIQPIRVFRPQRGRPYQILVGHRRFFAATLAGLPTIQAIIDPEEPDELTRLDLQLAENIQRRDLNDMERAMIIERYRGALTRKGQSRTETSAMSRTDADIAARLGIKPDRMVQLHRLTRFAELAQHRLVETGWSEWTLRPLIQAVERLALDEAAQVAALDALAARMATADQPLSRTLVADYVRQLEQTQRAAHPASWVTRDIQQFTNAHRGVIRFREQYHAGQALTDDERTSVRTALLTLRQEADHALRDLFGVDEAGVSL